MVRNKRILGGALLLSMSLLGGGLSMGFSNNGQPAIVKAADTKSQSTLAGWNTGKEVTYKGSEATYHAYLSEDGKNAWIYLVETSNKTKSLKFPDAVEGAVVTRVGYDTALRKLEDADEFNQNISGVTVEYAHGVDGWSEKTINVESVVLPKNLMILESTALSGLRKVKSITIPDGVQKISAETFYGCKSLKEVKLPKSLASFDNYTSFSACPKLSKVTLSKENKSFKMQKGLLLNKKGTKLIWAVPAKNKITVPDSVTSIADNALKAGKATSVYLGKKVKMIGKDAIAGKKITKVSIAKKNKSIAKQGQCIYEKKSGKLLIAVAKKNVVKIGNKVKLISEDASLCGSRQLKKLDIGASVKTLQGAWGEFYRAGYVTTTKVYFRSKNPPKLTQNNDKNYCYLPIFRDVYVPKASLKKYKKWYKKNDALQFVKLKTF